MQTISRYIVPLPPTADAMGEVIGTILLGHESGDRDLPISYSPNNGRVYLNRSHAGTLSADAIAALSAIQPDDGESHGWDTWMRAAIAAVTA